jgi:AraC-like DNA-binding protein
VTEACLAVGWASVGSFSSRFHRLVGQPPTRWQGAAPEAWERLPCCVGREVAVVRSGRIEEADLGPGS